MSDGEPLNDKVDTVKVNYLDNDAPIADAGDDFITCEYQFYIIPVNPMMSIGMNFL